jgi:predicted NAD/FAD-dependent oxidoreductase
MLALAIGVHFARAAQTPSPAPIAAMTMLCVAAWLYLAGLTFLSTPSVDAQSVAALMLSRGALAFILVAASVLSGVTLVAVSRIADNARLSHGLNIAGNLATVLFVLLGTPMAAMIV